MIEKEKFYLLLNLIWKKNQVMMANKLHYMELEILNGYGKKYVDMYLIMSLSM